MHSNMGTYHETHNIPWDRDWIDANYLDKDNYSIFGQQQWIGFLSLEWLDESAHIHTLQLTGAAQGQSNGVRVFEWIVARAREKKLARISCKTFHDNPAIGLYQKLGFETVAQERFLLEMEMQLPH